MKKRPSLRFRIVVAFVGMGLLMGPLLAGVFIYAQVELQEQQIESNLEDRLEDLEPATVAQLPIIPGTRGTRVLGIRPGVVAPVIDRLESGGNEFSTDTHHWYAFIGDTADNQRVLVAHQATELETTERRTLLLTGIGTVVAVYLSVWIGFWLSRRIVSPVRELADTVDRLPDDGGAGVDSGNYPDDEVGTLAQAFDRYTHRIRQHIQREQDLAADASHELRTPLAVIRGASEIIVADAALSDSSSRAAARIERATVRMEETISTLLLLAREPGQRPEAREIDLAALLDGIVDAQRDLVKTEHNAPTLYCDIFEHPRLVAPESAVRALVENLLRNAVKYTPEGQVRVTLEHDSLRIEDTGQGIPRVDLARITQRGVRGGNSIGTGSGLGLSIAQRLCDRHGWTLRIDSQEQTGTTVVWQFAV